MEHLRALRSGEPELHRVPIRLGALMMVPLMSQVLALAHVPKAMRPTRASQQRRQAGKASRAQVKQGRGRVSGGD